MRMIAGLEHPTEGEVIIGTEVMNGAEAGLKTIVFDEKLAWEKPCGGGLTYKAYQQYPFLIDNDTPKRLIRETVIGAANAGVKAQFAREVLFQRQRWLGKGGAQDVVARFGADVDAGAPLMATDCGNGPIGITRAASGVG